MNFQSKCLDFILRRTSHSKKCHWEWYFWHSLLGSSDTWCCSFSPASQQVEKFSHQLCLSFMTWSSCLGHTQPSCTILTHPIFHPRSDSVQELRARLSCFIVQERTGPQYTSRSPTEADTLKERMNEWLDTGPASARHHLFLYCRSQDPPLQKEGWASRCWAPCPASTQGLTERSWIWEMGDMAMRST